MLLRCQEDSHGRHRRRDLGQRILTDDIEIDCRLISQLDLELAVVAGWESVSRGQSGVDAGNHLRRIGRCQSLVVDSDHRRLCEKIDAVPRGADQACPRELADELKVAERILTFQSQPWPDAGEQRVCEISAGIRAIGALEQSGHGLANASKLYAAEGAQLE